MMRARRFWMQAHLWLGSTLGVIGALLGLTGSALVYDHALDRWMHPARYALSGTQAAQPFAQYVKSAQAAVGDARLVALRMPDGEYSPVSAILRSNDGMKRVYLDPPTAKALDVGTGNDLIGWLHQFHESLNLRDYGGRAIVGWVGVGMLTSSLSGLCLWWPAGGVRRTGVGFRRGFTLTRNLHYTLGFFGCIVLAMLSFTGIFLGFPDAARNVVGAMATVSPRTLQAAEGQGRAIGPDEAAAIALAVYSGASVTGIGFPQGPRGVYRISVRQRDDTRAKPGTVVFVDPRTRDMLAPSERASGDTFLLWQRILHEGSAFGRIYRFVVFLGGLLPALLVATGLVMWLRTRRRARASLHVPAVARDDRLAG